MEASIAILLVVATAIYLTWFTFTLRLLKGPRVWPLVGCLPGVFHNYDRFHDWVTDNFRRSGATFQTCLFLVPFLTRKHGLVTLTCDPKNVEHILKTHFNNYPKGATTLAALHDLYGDSIFNSDGETWVSQRKVTAMEFTPTRLRRAMAQQLNKTIKLRFCPILQTTQLESMIVDLEDLLLRLSFDNICALAFGKDPQTLSPRLPEHWFGSAFYVVIEALLQRFIVPQAIWKLKKRFRLGMEVGMRRSIQHVDQYLLDVIKTRKLELQQSLRTGQKENPHDDMLSRLIIQKELFPSDTSIQHALLSFIIAGRETSSGALSWFFWLLMLHPKVEEKILRETCRVLMDTRGDDISKWLEEPLGFEEVGRLDYLKAALSETLRLYPSVPINIREVVRDDVLPDGTFVPAGSKVVYSTYSAGRMEWTWGKDCMDFRPERWLSSDGKSYKEKSQFEFLAFNAGPRICLGKDMAYMQMKSIATAVLLRHRLTLVPGHCVEPKLTINLPMKNGMLVMVHHRDLVAVAAEIRKEMDGATPGGNVNCGSNLDTVD